MRDDLLGGLMATAIAAPLVVVCCGGAPLLAGLVGAGIGLVSGLGWFTIGPLAALAALIWRSVRRTRADGPDAPARPVAVTRR